MNLKGKKNIEYLFEQFALIELEKFLYHYRLTVEQKPQFSRVV